MAPMDNTTRGLILGLKIAGKSPADISELTGMRANTVSKLWARAVKRGFDPGKRPLDVSDSFFIDGRSAENSPAATPTAVSKKRKFTAKKRQSKDKTKNEEQDQETTDEKTEETTEEK
jgi:hypothetical protein